MRFGLSFWLCINLAWVWSPTFFTQNVFKSDLQKFCVKKVGLFKLEVSAYGPGCCILGAFAKRALVYFSMNDITGLYFHKWKMRHDFRHQKIQLNAPYQHTMHRIIEGIAYYLRVISSTPFVTKARQKEANNYRSCRMVSDTILRF